MKILGKIGLSVTILALVIGLAACGAPENSGGDAEKKGETAPKKLIVGCDTSFVPFEFLNEKTGEYEGFDIDMWDTIAKELELEYELQPMDFNGLIPALQSGTIDVAIAGMTIKETRKEKVDFARPYYDAGLLVLVMADDEEIKSVDDLGGEGGSHQNGNDKLRLLGGS